MKTKSELIEPCLAPCFQCKQVNMCTSKEHNHIGKDGMGNDVSVKYIYLCSECKI